jgi:hypothetical protein
METINPLVGYRAVPIKLLLPCGKAVSIPMCFHRFELWRGSPIADTYGGKAVLDVNGEPVFAELAILRLIQESGWEGVWIDTYRKKLRQSMPPHSRGDLPSHVQSFLDRANAGRKWRSGCPDVFAWKGSRYLFVEAKRKGKDRIGKKQKAWIESALDSDVPLESLLIFEWDILRQQTRKESFSCPVTVG